MQTTTMAEQPKRLEAVHTRAMKRFDAVWLVQKPERAECLDDRCFYSIRGAQWNDEWSSQFENAPRMEVNKTHKEVIRILSDYRNNRISVDFRPDDEDGDDETADALDGLYRADFEDCGQEAQDNAFEEGVGGGMGAWRLRACYEDEADPDNDYQRIAFEPITDADQRVFFDGNAKRQDKADAKWAILLTPIGKDVFEEQYDGKADSNFADWPVAHEGFCWHTDDVVYLGEYYEIEEKKVKKITLTHAVIEDEKVLLDPTDEQLADLQAQGWKIDRTRTIKQPKVTKYTLSGMEVLEEEVIAGPNIPIIVTYGKRWVVANIERCAGHTRYAKDPQRIYNAEVSQLAEIAACSPIERPIFDPEQVAGLEGQWSESNIKRHPYSLARALRNPDGSIAQAGQVGTVSPPSVPAATAALIQVTGQDIADIIGATDQNEEVKSNVSADAIELAHTRSDAKTFIYLDNFAKAVRRCGEVWLGMCAELYVEDERKMAAVDEQGGRKYIQIAQPALGSGGAQIVRNDFANAKHRVIVDVGPSSQSRKDATVRSLVGMAQMTNDQELESVLTGLALMNMDGEGIDDAQKWIRKRLVGMGVVQPTDEEKLEMQQEQANQPPSMADQLAAAKAAELQASAGEKKAGTVLKLAQAQAVGGPAEVPQAPDGLEAIHKAAQIGKTLADAEHIRTKTAHLPQELAIEATNAGTNRMKVERQPAK
jgi:hypothetical protein